MGFRFWIYAILILGFTSGKECLGMAGQESTKPLPAPPNKAAEFALEGSGLKIRYDNRVIFEGTLRNKPEDLTFNEVESGKDGIVHKVLIILSKSGKALLEGRIQASEESFPCEVDRKQGTSADLVRHSYGLSHSLLNRAVYDRKWDWVLSVDYSARVKIVPAETTDNHNHFQITAEGDEIALRFRPRFYQKHRGLSYFEPWTYKVWQRPVVGWSSWYAYFRDVDEQKMKAVADVLSERMKPYGLEYVQIDDGYQRDPIGFPDTWLKPNEKFPSGMDGLAKYILSKGLKAAVWTNVSFVQKDAAYANKDLFVLDGKGEPAWGRWVGYSLDGSNPEAIERIIRPVYRGFKEMGWQYFKVDALRHLRYEGYNSNTDHFRRKNADRVEAYRNVVKAVREEIGRDRFLLGCWGIRPELIGIIDGCRIGDDGYGVESLAQFNSLNNVVWRNDPDHIELSEQGAYRSCMAASLTGSLFLLTDKAEMYSTERIAPAVCSIPVLFTRPGQLYDVDPTRSLYLDRADTEMSGAGARMFDASRETPYDLFLLEVSKPYENWIVLGRTGERTRSISFRELGLEKDGSYLVFDFWAREFKGIRKGRMEFDKMDPRFNCQLYCIRKKQDHPQLLATSRHISCGGLELQDLKWADDTLRGSSQMVAGDSYTIYIWEPEGTEYDGFQCDGAKVLGTRKTGSVREIRIVLDHADTVDWSARYKQPTAQVSTPK